MYTTHLSRYRNATLYYAFTWCRGVGATGAAAPALVARGQINALPQPLPLSYLSLVQWFVSPTPSLFVSVGVHMHMDPPLFLLKGAFVKSKCTLIYCDNNQFVRTTGEW